MKTTNKTKSKTNQGVALLDMSPSPSTFEQLLIREPNGKIVPLATHILTGSYVPPSYEELQAFCVKMAAIIQVVDESLHCVKGDMLEDKDRVESLNKNLKSARGASRLIVLFKWLCHDILSMIKTHTLNMRISRAKKKLVNHPNMRQLIASVAKELKRQQS